MITQRTVVILGAGASQPYGFPTGPELISALQKINLDGGYYHGVRLKEDGLRTFQKELKRASPSSIDSFLEHRQEMQEFGKFLIAGHILNREHDSKLYPTDDHWYRHLLDKLSTSFDKLDFKNVSIVTFNYDRSLEQFLFQTLCSRYGKNCDEVAAMLSKLRIIHVYGHVGPLDWQDSKGRPYGPNPIEEHVREAARQIRIISEGRDDTEQLREARNLLNGAERIFFLGLAYHGENMARLGFPFTGRNVHTVSGSGYGLSHQEAEYFKDRYGIGFISSSDSKCVGFLRNDRNFVRLE